jgi:hypothetical protein
MFPSQLAGWNSLWQLTLLLLESFLMSESAPGYEERSLCFIFSINMLGLVFGRAVREEKIALIDNRAAGMNEGGAKNDARCINFRTTGCVSPRALNDDNQNAK